MKIEQIFPEVFTEAFSWNRKYNNFQRTACYIYVFRIHKKANPYVKRILRSVCNFLSENKATAYIFLATKPTFWATTKSKQASYTFHFAVKGISSIISGGLGVCFLKILLCTFNGVVNPLYRILLKNNRKRQLGKALQVQLIVTYFTALKHEIVALILWLLLALLSSKIQVKNSIFKITENFGFV